MAGLKNVGGQARSRARGVARRARRGVLGGDVADLRRRVDELESEVQECRALNLRLAELTDIVTELLLPVSQRDEEQLGASLEKYAQGL